MVETMTKTKALSLDELWQSVSIDGRIFDSGLLTDLPDLARCYLEYAIAPGTPLASAVRLWMHGKIKLGGKWHPFKGSDTVPGHEVPHRLKTFPRKCFRL